MAFTKTYLPLATQNIVGKVDRHLCNWGIVGIGSWILFFCRKSQIKHKYIWYGFFKDFTPEFIIH